MSTSIIAIVFSSIIFIVAVISGVSQLFTMFHTKNTSGTSLATYILLSLCAMFAIVWAYLYYFSRLKSWIDSSDEVPLIISQFAIAPTFATYTLDILGGITQCIIKGKHMIAAKNQHINEIALSKTILAKCKNKKEQYYPFIISLSLIFFITFITTALLIIFTTPSINPSIHFLDGNDSLINGLVIAFSVCGAALWEAISWPQFIKCIRTKDTSGISIIWAIFLPISCAICFAYGAVLAIKGNSFTFDTIGSLVFNGLIVNIGILVIKIINVVRAQRLNMSEIEYTKKYIQKKKKRA